MWDASYRPGNKPVLPLVGAGMDSAVRDALSHGGTVDITTIGAKTGLPRRIEIYFHQFDGKFYLTGRPGFKRDWVANIVANPEFTLHLKRGVKADVQVRGEPESDSEERGRILYRALTESWGSDPERSRAALDRWVGTAPFIRFEPVDQT
ncbi:MAG: nitroreductase/quinone reductase family protein [Acidimicrobiia bacterium]